MAKESQTDMSQAWVVRPNPSGEFRLDEFLSDNMVAIGWSDAGDLDGLDRSDIKTRLKQEYGYGPYTLGQEASQVDWFVNDMEVGDWVLVPDGNHIFFGKITGTYSHKPELVDEDYANQRKVEWKYDKKAIERSKLPEKLYSQLKNQRTVFEVDADAVNETLDTRGTEFTEGPLVDVQETYLEKLQTGTLDRVNSNTFEDVVATVLGAHYPGLSRQATHSDDQGDTDLQADLPGGVTVRVQVKYYRPEKGELGPDAVNQLAASMSAGDNGIIVTAGDISDDARNAAADRDEKIEFIDGTDFVQLVFENLDEFQVGELYDLGLTPRT